MKKLINLLTISSLIILMMTSCSPLNKMKKHATDIKYNVEPKVLEANAGKVDLDLDVNIPAKYFNKNVVVEATPVLVYGDQEKAFETKVLQGEDVKENNTVVPYNSSKSVKYKGSIPYDKAMRVAKLEMRLKLRKGDKTVDVPAIKIADGVVSTSTLVINDPKVVIGADAFQRIIKETKAADIHYLINSSYVRWKEMKGADVKDLESFIKDVKKNDRQELKGVEIKAYASPDGKEDENAKLAGKRDVSAKKFLKKKMRKIEEFKVEEFFKSLVTPEDWDGFKKLMEESNIQDKEIILRVLSMYNDPEVREREIKNISSAFTAIAKEILPKLRRSQILVNINNIGLSNEEILTAVKNDINSLKVEELLYSATLVEKAADKLMIYETAMKNFSQDWRGYNNAGLVKFNSKDYTAAKSLFEKAAALSQNNKVINNNLGAVELINGNVDKAKVFFGAAAGLGKALDYNNGIVAMKEGKYTEAVKYFGSCKTVNSALASILTDNTSEALRKLDEVKGEEAMVSYLRAVIGAKTSNKDLVIAGLKSAIEKDGSLKETASTDMVFAKYFSDADFKAIVK